MMLDPEVQSVVEELKAKALPPLEKSTVAERREIINVYREYQAAPLKVAAVHDSSIQGQVPVRFYRPAGAGPFPALIYYHGGGWIAGNLDLYDQPCRWLCVHGNCIVISVEYRLAPERKFPGPLEDAYAALEWAVSHAPALQINPERIAVGGDSSGGNLAAAVCLKARDEQGPAIWQQLLIYPVLNHDFGTASYREYATGPLLTRAAMEACWRYYLASEDDGRNPYASPLRAENPRGLPSACILTAECDPVRDDGEQYADRLQEAGVAVRQIRYPGTTHSLIHMTGRVAAARQMFNDASAALAAR